jgi:streptogrisin C
LIQDSPLPVELEADRSHSLAQMREALAQAEAVLERDGQFAYALDIQTATLLVLGPQEPTAASVAGAEEQVGMPVRFELSQLPTDQHTYGGAQLEVCTTGFTVRHDPTGVTGVLTAAHCPNTLTYTQPVTGPSYELTAQGGKDDSNQDFQWMTGSHAEYPQFWDGQYYRTVVAEVQRANMEGDWVCHRGKTTGTSCGTVTNAYYDPGPECGPENGDCDASWVRVDGPNLACAGGDSGGPWYSGGTAYGIHKGGLSLGTGQGECSYAVFMAIGYIWWEGDNSLLKG